MACYQVEIFGLMVLLINGWNSVIGTSFTVVNKCNKTVWPGIYSTIPANIAFGSTGFELTPGSSVSLQAPAGWTGRLWGRTGCNFTGSKNGSCTTGDCGSGQVQCYGSVYTPPVTIAEFTLDQNNMYGQDYYDISFNNGFNLPMAVAAIGGVSGSCASTGCIQDLNQKCPTELRAVGGAACKSAWGAFGTLEYCCTGNYSTPETCVPTNYSMYFKSACPASYSYAYDDKDNTVTCTAANYTITFCPSSLVSQNPSNSNGSTDGLVTGPAPSDSPAPSNFPNITGPAPSNFPDITGDRVFTKSGKKL